MKYAFFDDKRSFNFFLSYLFGIILGTVIFNCLDLEQKNNLYIYSDYIYNRIAIKEFLGYDYFKYVLFYRLREIILLLFLGLTKYKNIFYYIFLVVVGIKLSILICSLCVFQGVKALLLLPLILLPQLIFRIIMIWDIINYEMVSNIMEKSVFKYIIKILICFILCVFSEAILNPLIINTFLKI